MAQNYKEFNNLSHSVERHMKIFIRSIFLIFFTFLLLELCLHLLFEEETFFYRFLGGYKIAKPWSIEEWDTYYEKLHNSPKSYLKYDRLLGWSVRKNSHSNNGLYHSNNIGIRSFVPTDSVKKDGTLRIALFGDSFTHGDDVPYKQTWCYYLDSLFREDSITVELLNFGVGGYGMDQAFLRYMHEGRKMKSDIILFGLQLENFWRNINTFRPYYYPSSQIRLSKPRALVQKDRLTWINQPTIPTEHLTAFIQKPKTFVKHDYFYHNSLIKNDFSYSYTYLTLKDLWHKLKSRNQRENVPQGMKLMQKIIASFHLQVVNDSAQFMMVHLPTTEDLDNQIKTEITLDIIEKTYPIISTMSVFKGFENDQTFNGHYNSLGNQLIAKEIYKRLKPSIHQ